MTSLLHALPPLLPHPRAPREMSDPPARSSLSGVHGLAARAHDTVKLAAEFGEINLVDEGRRLLDDYDRAQSLRPGDPLRTTIASRLYDFERRALDALAIKMKDQP